MTTTLVTIPIGDTDWNLTNLNNTPTPVPCDHCDRPVKRGFVITNPDGQEMRVGRGCVKQLTGWTLETAEAKRMLRQAARIQEIADRVATILTEFPTLTETQVTDVAIHDHNWRTNNWRRHAANLTR